MSLPRQSVLSCLLLPMACVAMANGLQSHFSLPPDPFPDLPIAAQPPDILPMPQPALKPGDVPTQRLMPVVPAKQETVPSAQSATSVASPKPETLTPLKPVTRLVPGEQETRPPESTPTPQRKPPPIVDLTVNDFLADLKMAARSKQLTIHAPSELVVGQTLQFSVTSKHDCFLTVLVFSRDGGQMLVFPNRGQPDYLLRARHRLTIPSLDAATELAIQGESGTETLVAVCRPDKTPLYQDGYLFPNKPFIQLRPGKHVDPKLMLAQPLITLGEWAVANIAIKNYRIKFE